MLGAGINTGKRETAFGLTTKRKTMKVTADGYFAIVPEWVLYADVSSAAVRVFATLNRYANSETAKCHPSRATIAKKCHINVKTVDRAIGELVEIGAVQVEHRKVDGSDEYTSNEYTLAMSPGGVKNTLPWCKNGTTGGDKNGKQTKAIKNQRNESDTSSSVDDGFDLFWSNYPRKVGKGAARKAWKAALKKTDAEMLQECALLYRITCPKDPQYIAHPATWLNAERWLDDMNPEPETPEPEIPRWEPCSKCNNGWLYTTDDKGYEYAHPCECRP